MQGTLEQHLNGAAAKKHKILALEIYKTYLNLLWKTITCQYLWQNIFQILFQESRFKQTANIPVFHQEHLIKALLPMESLM